MRNNGIFTKKQRSSKIKAYIFAAGAIVLGVLIFVLAVGKPSSENLPKETPARDYRVVAYVTPWNWSGLPDAQS